MLFLHRAVGFLLKSLEQSILQQYFLALQDCPTSVFILILSWLFFIWEESTYECRLGTLQTGSFYLYSILSVRLPLSQGNIINKTFVQNYYFNTLQALVHLKFIFLNSFLQSLLYFIIPALMETPQTKIQAFRVSIRKEHLYNYIKSKRKDMIEHKLKKTQQEQEEIDLYWNLLNHTTFENLLCMDKQTFSNHLQMLNQIVSLPQVDPYVDRFQPILCVVIQFFEHTYNELFHTVTICEDNFEYASKDDILPIVVMNQILTFVSPSQLTKFIGSIYYEIVPHNKVVLNKILILIRQMLSFSVKDACVISDYLKKAQNIGSQAVQSSIHRNFILMILMNITCSEDEIILDLVYQENFIQNISEWIEVYGFTSAQKESIAGIYANMIEYLCGLLHKNSNETEIVEERSPDYFLFLPIFEDLVKEDNQPIMQKMTFVCIQLINVSVSSQLECKQYVFELAEELIRKIVENKEYLECSEELFIVFVQNSEIKGHFGWVCEFLNIILNKHALLYYGSDEKEKKKYKSNSQGQDSSQKIKILRNMSKLISTCENVLRNQSLLSQVQLRLDCQKEIVSELVNFWCREELQPLQEQFLRFMAAAVESNTDLSEFCLTNDKIVEVLVFLLNHSYEYAGEIDAAMELTFLFLNRLGKARQEFRIKFIEQYREMLCEIRVRVQDYCMGKAELSPKMAQINLAELNNLLTGSEEI